MASTSASYRKPEPSLTHEMRREQMETQRTLHQVARDLQALCEMGIVEAFSDENNVTRYRPTQRAA